MEKPRARLLHQYLS